MNALHQMPSIQFEIWRRIAKKANMDKLNIPPGNSRGRKISYLESKTYDKITELRLSRKRAHIMSTFVPDIILKYNYLTTTAEDSFMVILMFVDVSGFTAMTEKYNNTGRGGTYRLTCTLNSYLGLMVEVIYGHGGDVLKFSGDGFLACWKLNNNKMRLLCHDVISCALHIQSRLGSFETDVDAVLSVKIGISAGLVTFSVIGNDSCKTFIMKGLPMSEVKMAEHYCKSGEVVLSPSAWSYCIHEHYESTTIKNKCVKIHNILTNPSETSRQTIEFQSVTFISNSPKVSKELQGIEDLPIVSFGGETIDENDQRLIERTMSVRPICRLQGPEEIRNLLYPFIMKSVMLQIDADKTLEYLTEMRQVTTIFVMISLERKAGKQMISIIDTAYQTLCRIMNEMNAVVNKVTCFDKGILFLAVFGLRGRKQITESRAILKCAYNIQQTMLTMGKIEEVSVGVTTGMAYCGVVGHPLRREYTVIGATVNKAARIVIAYPNKVTCCRQTKLNAKLASHYFCLQQNKRLKGFDKVVPIYQYSEDVQNNITKSNYLMLPILGRSEEEELFVSMVAAMKRRRAEYNGLLFIGDQGIGKSRLLDQCIAQSVVRDLHVATIALNPQVTVVTPYCTIYKIVKQVLHMDDDISVANKEDQLAAIMANHIKQEHFFYINEVMKVHFPVIHTFWETVERREANKLKIVTDLCKLIFSNPGVVIAIDDVQHIDKESWMFLSNILDCVDNCFLLMSLYQDSFKSITKCVFDIINKNNIKIAKLRGLKKDYLPALACQMLGVSAIPTVLNDIICEQSQGNPEWVENYLINLNQNNSLRIIYVADSVVEDKCNRKEVVVPHVQEVNYKDLKIPAIEKAGYNTTYLSHESLDVAATAVCELTEAFHFEQGACPQIDIILTIFDKLSAFEKAVVCTAAVISFGNLFTRPMLEYVLYQFEDNETHLAIKNLFICRIFECATDIVDEMRAYETNFAIQRMRSFFSKISPTFRCYCSKTTNKETSDELPRFAYCELLRFSHSSYRNIFYDSVPANQRKMLHNRAAQFLESEAHMCSACGGGCFTTSVILHGDFESDSSDSVMKIINPTFSYHGKKSFYGYSTTLDINDDVKSNTLGEASRAHDIVFKKSSFSNVPQKIQINVELKYGDVSRDSSIVSVIRVTKKRRFITFPQTMGRKYPSHESSENSLKSSYDVLRIHQPDSLDNSLIERTNSDPIEQRERLSLIENLQTTHKDSKYDIFLGRSDGSILVFEPVLPDTTILSSYNRISILMRQFRRNSLLQAQHLLHHERDGTDANPFRLQTKSSFLHQLQEQINIMDFKDCTCPQIMSGVHQQLIYHCVNAALKCKQIYFQIQCGAAAIFVNSNWHALVLLNEVAEIIKKDQTTEKPLLNRFLRKLYLGQVYTLMGQANLNQGFNLPAETYFLTAMKCFGHPFRKATMLAHERLFREKTVLWINSAGCMPLSSRKSAEDDALRIEMSKCLSLLSTLYLHQNEALFAKLAAMRSLNLIRNIDTDLEVICNAFSTIMDVYTHFGEIKRSLNLEFAANRIINNKYYEAGLRQLAALGKLFCSTFYSRLLQGNINTALRVGFRTLQISNKIYENKVKLKILPLLVQLLVLHQRVSEAVDLNIQLQAAALENNDHNCLTWYYALCLGLHLSSGFKLIPTEDVLEFASTTIMQQSHSSYRTEIGCWKESTARKRLIINVWMYSLRTDTQEYFTQFERMAMGYKDDLVNVSPNSLSSNIKLIECQLIQLLHYINQRRNKKEIKAFRKDIGNQIKQFSKVSKSAKIMMPRLLHLHAYYLLLGKQRAAALAKLKVAERMAEKHENFLEVAWIRHNRAVWTKNTRGMNTNFWLDQDGVDWHEAKHYNASDWTNIMYTLAVPTRYI